MSQLKENVKQLTTRLLQQDRIETEIRAMIDADRERTVAEVRGMIDAQWDRVRNDPWLRDRVDKGTQTLLLYAYRDMLREGKPLPKLDEVGFRAYSQFDEDGILLYLFSLLGVAHKSSVEICAGIGYECNTANLIINHAWDGLLIDGNPEHVRIGRAFYAAHPDTFWRQPTFVQAWVDVESINDRITENGFTGEIDLFSLDMDGVDFWVWKAITCINPRVVVLEINPVVPADLCVAIRYDREFVYTWDKKAYNNASLAAWVKLGREKGYRLVGCNRNRVNAFFVRNDLGADLLPEVSVASCLDNRFSREMVAAQWAEVADKDWVAV